MASSITASVGRSGRNKASDVIKVQGLLNTAGANPRLTVDGVAGPKTMRAVSLFQSKLMRTPDGRVDPSGKTIKALAAGATVSSTNSIHKLVIDVIDENDIVGWLTGATTWDEIGVSNVLDMVNKVSARARPFGLKSVYRLGVFGHSSPGAQHLGTGGNSWDKSQVLSAGNVNKLHGANLARLKPYMRTDAIVTLHGCSVAKGQGGRLLLQRFSKILGVPVQGGVEIQRPLVPGMEGDVVRCTPLRCTKHGSTWLGVPK